MRLVFLSDTHGVKLQNAVPDGDVLIHCGDFCKKGNEKELRAFNDWFFSFPHPKKIFIAGNHDLMFENDPVSARSLVPDGVYLQDESVVVDGLHIYGAPWTPEFFSWAFMRPRGPDMKERWSKIPRGVDVLVTHGPPMGVLDFVPGSNSHVGCEELAAAVRDIRPAVHAFGHIHEGYGTMIRDWENGEKTIFANASACNLKYAGINPSLVFDVVRKQPGKRAEAILVPTVSL